jgi:hypothetical protein
MRDWNTDARISVDTRYAPWLRALERRGWPLWLIQALHRLTGP